MDAIACDVLVVGAGNAGLCSAASAAEHGARVVVLEKAPRQDRGGNSAMTVAMRVVAATLDELLMLTPPDLDADGRAAIEERFAPIDADGYYEEVMRATDGRSDPELLRTLATQARSTIEWLHRRGHRWVPSIERTTMSPVMMAGRGRGYQERNFAQLEAQGVTILYEASALDLLGDAAHGIRGAVVSHGGKPLRIEAGATVLACGGYEGDPAMRAAYLGRGWDTVHMRGVPFNTGDGLRMAMALGAATQGDWSHAHASPQDWDRPNGGRPSTEQLEEGAFSWSRYAFPFGIMVNRDGRRFVDEAPDVRSRTYAKLGREILAQPGGAAFQIFDADVRARGLIPDAYGIGSSRARADSLEELAVRLGIAAEPLIETVRDFNAAVPAGATAVPSPTRTDGVGTRGIWPPKSNFAMPLTRPPFEGYKVRCAITFTLGGLRIDPSTAAVMHNGGWPIPGLYAAGGIVGGLFTGNYSGGSALTSGAVFGRIAGASAARAAKG